ncbi:MAG: argininosuccinate lyase [Candidatus Omnitrophica bacterium]|nr:argininosuccinate lyase [Candidatus Omnitrophota bacterium]
MEGKLWGGRFKGKVDKNFEEFSSSIRYDYKLAKFDIYHSMIHILALKEANILTSDEYERLNQALENILRDVEEGRFSYHHLSEDIHTDIQNKVSNIVGNLGDKLHTLRSRNDQVSFDEKWYCIEEIDEAIDLLKDLVNVFKGVYRKFKREFFIAYTHTRRAQIITFKDYIDTFSRMFNSDKERLSSLRRREKVYIGSGAVSGTVLKDAYKKAIKIFTNKRGFDFIPIELSSSPPFNVSNRDFIIEFLSCLAILQMHLSRLCEDLILYSTQEFNYFILPEEFCTGSSLMPHKKNPDFLELVRGYTGIVYGNLFSLLTTMKGLPLTYNRDMQLDKEPLFSSVDIVKEELKIMIEFIERIELNKSSVEEALKDDSLYATELVQFLVFQGLAFKEAHKIIGQLVRYCEDKKASLKDMSDEELKKFHAYLTVSNLKKIMNPRYVVSLRK